MARYGITVFPEIFAASIITRFESLKCQEADFWLQGKETVSARKIALLLCWKVNFVSQQFFGLLIGK